MSPEQLCPGNLYYVLGYADEKFATPVVSTVRYLRAHNALEETEIHIFEFFATQDLLELSARNLDIIFTLPGLIHELQSRASHGA